MVKQRHKQKNEQHEFAFYVPYVHQNRGPELVLTDKKLLHRMRSVLRFESGYELVLFDSSQNMHCRVIDISSGSLSLELLQRRDNQRLKPHVTWGLPLLKRQALESALYTFTELGCQSVQLLVTEKSRRDSHERLERYENIFIAAAEQSKQFALPVLLPPVSLVEWVKSMSADEIVGVFFDPKGAQMPAVLKATDSEKSLVCISGPEGDLTSNEKEVLKACGFMFCSLTETVLRAESAVALGLGCIRMMMRGVNGA